MYIPNKRLLLPVTVLKENPTEKWVRDMTRYLCVCLCVNDQFPFCDKREIDGSQTKEKMFKVINNQ